MGLAILGAVLEKEGHEAVILDAYAERIGLDGFRKWLLKQEEADYIGFSVTTPQVAFSLEQAKIAKEIFPDATVVMGGVHPTVMPEEILRESQVDLVVRGEAEISILELAAGKDPAEIAGVSWKGPHGAVHNPDAPVVKDLDSLPIPAYHLLPMHLYKPAAGANKRLPATSMLSSRGCPGHCTFCYRHTGKVLRVLSGRRVAEEVKYLQENYGIQEICFYDDTFTAKKQRVYDFLDAIREGNIDISWSCFSRVDTVDENLLSAMKAGGCHQIMYGIESASEIILNNVRKRINLKLVEQAVRAAKKAKIDVRAAFMLGNPGETLETMRETLEYAIKLNPEIVIFNITTPFPGSEMFAWARENGFLVTEDWTKYDFAQSIMRLPTITTDEIQDFYGKAYRRFYFRPRYIFMRLAKLRSWEDIKNAWRAVKGILTT
ncbi:hypothetical protein AAU61_01045 [Desulfocarbo indianensis]|nr:hypothetical protein AAU61_01045 [Desulfocarbo indianensis]